jgi:hypothetical protein
MLILILHGQVILRIIVLSLVTAFSLALLQLHGNQRNKMQYHALVLKQSLGQALATTTAEIIWLKWLLNDLGFSCDASTPLFCDNTSAIQIANNPIKHELTKHIGVDASFIRFHCQQSTIALKYIFSKLQLTDFFTKTQTKKQHCFYLLKLKCSINMLCIQPMRPMGQVAYCSYVYMYTRPNVIGHQVFHFLHSVVASEQIYL